VKRITKILVLIVCLVITAAFWCKLDRVEVIHSTYRPEEVEVVDEVKVSPCLLPRNATVEPSLFFKQKLVWQGPHMFRVSFRDFGKTVQGARLSSIRLSNIDGTWQKELSPLDEQDDWQAFHVQSWTQEFAEAVCIATMLPRGPNIDHFSNIHLPNEDTLNVQVEYELKLSDQTHALSSQFTLNLEPKKTYQSYLVASIIGA
jgi:hypothetical protein